MIVVHLPIIKHGPLTTTAPSHPDRKLAAVAAVVTRQDATLSRLAAETVGFVCSHASLVPAALAAGMLRCLLLFFSSGDRELTFWAMALTVNVVCI